MKKVIDSHTQRVSKAFENESMQNLLDHMSADWTAKFSQFNRMGTNTEVNRADPMGDGDQSPIKIYSNAQFHRDIWSAGGNTHDLVLAGKLPTFIMGCLTGNLEECGKMLGSASEDDKRALLETRYTILRLSALFFCFVGHGMIRTRAGQAVRHLEVVQLLLSHGARVGARDLCGKTVIHYAIGPMCPEGSTSMLDLADACIAQAAEQGLSPSLVDWQDRFGGVPLLQPIMMNRLDLVTYLCVKHKANCTIADHDGTSAESMSGFSGDIRRIISRQWTKQVYRKLRNQCVNCGLEDVATSKCGKCFVATYCSRDCQRAHWKEHKKVCVLQEDGPGFIVKADTSMSGEVMENYTTGERNISNWSGAVPSPLKLNEYFDVKIQVGEDPSSAMLLYPQRRELHFQFDQRHCERFPELFDMIHEFKAFDGRKGYFKAKITRPGELFISSKSIFVCKW